MDTFINIKYERNTVLRIHDAGIELSISRKGTSTPLAYSAYLSLAFPSLRNSYHLFSLSLVH